MCPELNTPNQSQNASLGDLLLRIGNNKDFPTFSKSIIEINRHFSSRSSHSSASDLSNTILQDYALTNKLLKLVNSAFYNLTGGKVTTVTRAVVLLGYEKVRSAATNLMILDLMEGESAGAELREAYVRAFWCGLIAKDVAEAMALEEEEEAFICAMFHDLGRHLVLLYLPDKCDEIANLISTKGFSESEASKMALGSSYEELGIAMAQRWNFPAEIIDSMNRLSREELQKHKGKVNALQALSNFSNELCSIITDTQGKKREIALSTLTKQYNKHVSLSSEQLDGMIAASLKKVKTHAELLNIRLESSPFLKRLPVDAPRQQPDQGEQTLVSDLALEVSNVLVDSRSKSDDSSARINAARKTNQVEVIINGIQDMSAAMVREYKVNDIALMALESMYRGFGFNRVVFFAMKKDGKQMEARFGFGTAIETIANRVSFETNSTRNIFSIALDKEKDLIIENTDEPNICELIPRWFRRRINAPAFVFLPITLEKACLGAFYADRKYVGPPLEEGQYKFLVMLRNQLILAIKYRSL